MGPGPIRPTRAMFTYMLVVTTVLHLVVAGLTYWGSTLADAPPFMVDHPWAVPAIVLGLLPVDLVVIHHLRTKVAA